MKKSRPWAALFAVVVLAALVVLSGCQGAVGPAGKDGADGKDGVSGTDGTAGTPGTTDNASPVATVIPTVYLAMNGIVAPAPVTPAPTPPAIPEEKTDTGYRVDKVDLNKYFTDATSPTLAYKAKSSDVKIAKINAAATTEVVTGGNLVITAVKAGTAIITVKAYDGVNAAVESTFNVVVVTNNVAPTVTVTDPVDDLTGESKLLVSSGTVTYPFTATINPGTIGTEKEGLTFRPVVGNGTAADKIATVVVTHVSGNDYSIAITPLATLIQDKTLPRLVTVFAVDSFGAETVVDLNGPETVMPVDGLWVAVNAPPRLAVPLPDATLYRLAPATNNAMAPGAGTAERVSAVEYTVSDYFDVEYDAGADAAKGDTTCLVATSPKQPTNTITDPVKAASFASVVNALPTPENNDPARPHEVLTVTVQASAEATTDVTTSMAAGGIGSFDLTITCSDGEASASSTATITVRPAPAS